jgi:crossover junction endodeoxyribonuclease RuvC
MNDDEKTPAILGIDPGLDGAVAWILPGRAEARVVPTLPASKAGRRRFDVAGMVALLKAHPVDLAILEAVSAAPVAGRVQGTTSMFGFGRGLGTWEGILAALAIPHMAVTPQIWKKAVLAGTARDKPAAIAFAQGLFPGVSLLPTPRCRVPHDGLAEALCLAEYGRRLLAGSPSAPGPVGGPARPSLTHDRHRRRS